MASTQEGYRWRADDGSESAATWLAAQDTNITRDKQTATRLRVLIDHDADPASQAATLQYKLDTDGAAEWLDVLADEFEMTDLADLWAWTWAGENGENVRYVEQAGATTHRGCLKATNLASPGTNDFTNAGTAGLPAYDEPFAYNTYTPPYPALMLEQWSNGDQAGGQGMVQATAMGATGEFYLAAIFQNTRTAGQRYLMGVTANNHYVRVDQLNHNVDIRFGTAGSEITLTAASSLNTTGTKLNIVEIWRDSSNDLHCWINGSDATSGTPNDTTTFDIKGFGGGEGGGGSDWDDHAFELVFCDGLPTATERLQVRHKLNDRWQAGLL